MKNSASGKDVPLKIKGDIIMAQNDRLSLGRAILKSRFLFLLVFLLLLIALQPLDEVIGELGILLDLIVTAILMLSIFAISQKKNHMISGILLAVPMFVFLWAFKIYKATWMSASSSICGIAFFGLTIVVILKIIFSRDEIEGDLIAGAAVVYLLIAIIWTHAFRLIELMHPGSFTLAESQTMDYAAPFLYYSFVTMTTLGYGDIFPVTTAAKSFAILEAIIGQLYLVIMVAWLVGVHISQSMSKKKRRTRELKSDDD
jgi:hypothetical protein